MPATQQDIDQFKDRCRKALDKFIGKPTSHDIKKEICSVLYAELVSFLIVHGDDENETIH